MNLIENIKLFFEKKGLKWTGEIITHRKEDFRPATAEDFKFLSNADYLIDFGEDGKIALSAEIDEVTFKIYGESFDFCYSCYAGDNEKNIKLIRKLEDKDFSKEFIKFQLEKCGLVYATLLRRKCEEQKQKVEEEKEKRVKQLTRKIDYLGRSIVKTEENAKKQIRQIKSIENLAKRYETEV